MSFLEAMFFLCGCLAFLLPLRKKQSGGGQELPVCATCKYDLTGLPPGSRCPECGGTIRGESEPRSYFGYSGVDASLLVFTVFVAMIHQPIVAGVWRLMYQSRYPLLVPAFVARLCDGVSESLIAAVCVLGPLIVLLARPIRDRVRLVGVSISIVGFIGTHVAFAWFSGARSWMPDFETRGGAVAPFLLLLVFVPVSLVAMYLANLIVERRSRASAIPDPSPVSLA